MKDVLLDIIGEFVPIETATDTYIVDWPWIFSAGLFIVLVAVTAWFSCRVIVGVLHK